MFKLNRKTEYGILALQYMADLQANQVATAKEIAEKLRIPQTLLAKILQQLMRERIIRSVQGAHGGYVMQDQAWALTLADIVQVLEGPIRLTDCRSENSCCARIDICDLRDTFEPVQKSLVEAFSSIKLIDFLRVRSSGLATDAVVEGGSGS